MEGWRLLLTKFALFYERPFPDWLPIHRDLEHRTVDTPEELSGLDIGAAARLAESTNEPILIRKLWNSACANSKQFQPTGDRLRPDTHASLLDQPCREAPNGDTMVAANARHSKAALSSPGNFDTLRPIALTRALGHPGNDSVEIRSLLHATSSINVLRQCLESLRAVAPGVERYADFRCLHAITSTPPAH